MAIGASLLEEYIYRNGLMINSSYGNYRIPTFREMPLRSRFHSFFDPDPLPHGPWGSKGVGEGTMLAVAPALANAIYKAVGIRVKDLPLNPERILRALKFKKESSGGQGRQQKMEG